MELRSFKNPNRLQLVLAALMLVLIGLVSARPVHAEGTLISAPNRVDIVHDPMGGGIRYVSLVNDTTPPVIVPSVTPSTNLNGWYNTDVSVSWDVSDPESGIASSSGCATQTWTNETLGTTLTCSATNGAGLSASQSVTVKIDKTPPTVTCAPRTSPNANGWYNSTVGVPTTATDALSGVAVLTSEAILVNEGAGQSVTCLAGDWAGNFGTATASNINIDRTAPQMIVGRTAPNGNGWNNTDVTVTFGCTDPLSGVASSSGPSTLSNEGANQSVTGTCTDKAGNTVTQVVSNINIDKTPPTVTCVPTTSPNVNGWYNSDVVVPTVATDALSGISTIVSVTLHDDGAGQSVTCSAADWAGNTGTATASNINIDKTRPTISITSPQAKDYVHTGIFTATWTTNDPLSGIATNSGKLDGNAIKNGQAIDLFYLSLGLHTVTVDVSDKAGNSASASVAFKVVADINSLIAAKERACALGWINKKAVCVALDVTLRAAKEAINHGKTQVAKEVLNGFIKELNFQKGKAVNQQAYDLLKADALYVISTLP